MTNTINIAEDYTPLVGGRYVEDGEGNGTTFRQDYLVPLLHASGENPVIVILDGAAGYPSSFLEEAFGGLVREEGFASDWLLRKLSFVAREPGYARYIPQIQAYLKQAKPLKAG